MKKRFFYVALAAIAITSCSKNADIVNPSDNEDKQLIKFVMGSSIEVSTRGTGAVGGDDTSSNEWAGEKLNVFMFNKGTLDLTLDPTNKNTPFFDNTEITAPNGTGAATWGNYGNAKYYPGTGNYDFFAYHADDAVNGDLDEAAYTLPFKINGTQDLMVAKALMNKADTTKYLGNTTTKDPDCSRIYSAYSARRDIHPRFQFEHLLTRLVFHVIGAEEGVDDATFGVEIDSVVIKNTRNEGKMKVAYVGNKPSQLIEWENATDDFRLTQRAVAGNPVETLQSVKPIYNDTVSLGESMLLCPSDSYQLIVYSSQYPDQHSIDNDLEVVSFYETTLALDGGASFEAGKQYNVFFKVYKAQEIKLELELTSWENAGDIPVDSEDEI